jgi:nicotinamide-nucleotide adenylyltransferase
MKKEKSMKEKIGLYVGRFQPFHRGHLSIVREALEKCDRLIIAIGSAQESKTKKNPFTFEERRKFIWRSLKGMNEKVIIVPLYDRDKYGDDCTWGQYVLDSVVKECGLWPTINFEGEEVCRSTWFEGIDIERKVFDREVVPFTATAVRKALKDDDCNAFYYMAPTGTWIYYESMRQRILEVENGKV